MPVDGNLLAGIDLSQFNEAEQGKILENLYQRLEDRVGRQVEAIVPDTKFDEFETLIDSMDEKKLSQWLDVNVPDYDDIVQKTLDQLKQEVTANPTSFLEPEPEVASDDDILE
jgi:predicted nucleic acid-binding protein